ncbi:MAG: hypothetical protein ACOX6J_02670 [Oscillospiraceae bacterium]|jgi:hypothetical protein
MNFIPIIKTAVEEDTLPVLKTAFYPGTYGSFKLYMQYRPSIMDGQLHAALFNYERDPDISMDKMTDGSCCAVSLSRDQNSEVITAIVSADGRGVLCLTGGPEKGVISKEQITPSISNGLDEVGWFWAASWTFPPDYISSMFPDGLAEGSSVFMNAYTFQNKGQFARFGAVLPVSEKSIFSPVNLHEFKIMRF